ncbi:MAG: DUF2933 domain-containing protein [Bacteroidetes bacterium]|jgi:hypothetical protein|nr:DUF2933 domain-containing protein [Bacteroidota bacterium]MDP7320952.1 DUF2933 domain-containing protein [Bacteriovoracaceae bacterium]|tara:strand:- start:289 stop:549 length:261 start_codon:yes stop_codon:yes gene_type:complete
MNTNEIKNFWKNPIVLICVVAVGYWVYTYHLEHALGLLPYAILLLCPLMHIFMHGGHGHGGHGGHHSHNNNEECNHDNKKEEHNAR